MVNEIHTLLSNTGNTISSNGAVNNLVNLLEKDTAEYVEFIDVYERI